MKGFITLALCLAILFLVIVNKAKSNPDFCTDYHIYKVVNCKTTDGKMHP